MSTLKKKLLVTFIICFFVEEGKEGSFTQKFLIGAGWEIQYENGSRRRVGVK
jgi:hypothetical protein